MNNHRQLTQDLVQMAQSAHFLDGLARLDEAQLKRILAILSDPRAVQAVRRLVAMALDFKKGRHRESDVEASSSSTDQPEDLISALERLFNDSEKFRTVAEVARFAKSTLGINAAYQKESRHAYVRKLLHQLRRDPALLERASASLSENLSPKDEAYSLLYNYIRGRK